VCLKGRDIPEKNTNIARESLKKIGKKIVGFKMFGEKQQN